MSIFRAYLINAETGKEMTSHPLHGKTWIATSGNISVDGEFVRGTAESIMVADYANLHTVKGTAEIRADLFTHPVVVKVWLGPDREGIARYDWRYLLREGQELTELDRKRAARCVLRSTDD